MIKETPKVVDDGNCYIQSITMQLTKHQVALRHNNNNITGLHNTKGLGHMLRICRDSPEVSQVIWRAVRI